MLTYNCPHCGAENEAEKETWYDGDWLDDAECYSCGETVEVHASVDIQLHAYKPEKETL